MNTPNTHNQLPENLIVVDREWLENEIERTKSGIYDAHLVLKSIRDKSYPLTPILEDAWSKSYQRSLENTTSTTCQQHDLEEYSSQPITLKKK